VGRLFNARVEGDWVINDESGTRVRLLDDRDMVGAVDRLIAKQTRCSDGRVRTWDQQDWGTALLTVCGKSGAVYGDILLTVAS
jgi:hypothetical protein